MVRTSTSALRVRIYLLLMNCKLALRRNLHYAGFRQYSTHVPIIRDDIVWKWESHIMAFDACSNHYPVI